MHASVANARLSYTHKGSSCWIYHPKDTRQDREMGSVPGETQGRVCVSNLETKASAERPPSCAPTWANFELHMKMDARLYISKKKKKKGSDLNWWANVSHRDHLLGFWGKRVQLLQWIISLTTATSVGGGGGTSPRPGIMGLMGVIPAIMLRPGSKLGTQMESVKHTR